MPRPGVADLEADPAAVRGRDPATVTRPPAGVWRSALATRFARTSRIRTGSMSRIGRSLLDTRRSARRRQRPPPARTSARRRRRGRSGSVGSRWRASVPASDSASVRRSSMSRARTCVSSRIEREVFGVGRVDAVDDRLEVALDDGQRRPQLVADLGQQGAALALVGLQARRHRVEAGTSWRTARRPRARPDAHGVVAGLDRAGRLDELVERRGGRPERRARSRPGRRRRRPAR